MKSLKIYSKEISKATPTELADILVEMTSDYGEVCEMKIPIEVKKINFWLENKKLDSQKPVSDVTLKMLWQRDGEGVLERRIEVYEKAMEKMMSNVKAVLRQRENEGRNLQ